MDTGIQTSQEVNTQNAPDPAAAGAEPQKTFTQEDVNHIVAKRVAKYADYEALKEKAAKYDEQVEAGKSELQKATEKAASLQAELDALKNEAAIRTMRGEVASAKGVPADLLNGTTREECEAQADAILRFAKPNGYPRVPDGGEPQNHVKKATRDQFADWLNNVM